MPCRKNNIPEFSYDVVKKATDNFNESDFKIDGRRIGDGRYACVFLAYNLIKNINPTVVK